MAADPGFLHSDEGRNNQGNSHVSILLLSLLFPATQLRAQTQRLFGAESLEFVPLPTNKDLLLGS